MGKALNCKNIYLMYAKNYIYIDIHTYINIHTTHTHIPLESKGNQEDMHFIKLHRFPYLGIGNITNRQASRPLVSRCAKGGSLAGRNRSIK